MFIDSLKKNKIGIILMLCSSAFVCTGQLLWKIANGSQLLPLTIGFVLYGFGALFMLSAYKFGKVSILQPILSINYVISLLLGYFILKEDISIIKIISIFIITTGVIFIVGGDTND